jgi:prevent-host-death family protein
VIVAGRLGGMVSHAWDNAGMAEVTVRELRNHAGDVLDRVAAGERLTVTRGGRPVAELRPLPTVALRSTELLGRWRRVPAVDSASLRTDLDAAFDRRM